VRVNTQYAGLAGIVDEFAIGLDDYWRSSNDSAGQDAWRRDRDRRRRDRHPYGVTFPIAAKKKPS